MNIIFEIKNINFIICLKKNDQTNVLGAFE